MSDVFPPLDGPTIRQLAKIIAANCSGSEIVGLFEDSGFGTPHLEGGKEGTVTRALFKLQKSVAPGSPPSSLYVQKVIHTFSNPVRFANDSYKAQVVRESLNRVLAPSGLQVGRYGLIPKADASAAAPDTETSLDRASFDGREFHPTVVEHSRDRFCRSDYFYSVFESCKAFDRAVSVATCIQESGEKLMGRAFAENGPIRVNSGLTESEKDEQRGIMNLAKGVVAAIRNPQGHEPEAHWPMNREDALDILTLISFLFRKLDASTANGKRVHL